MQDVIANSQDPAGRLHRAAEEVMSEASLLNGRVPFYALWMQRKDVWLM